MKVHDILLSKLSNILVRVRTPLTLAALVVLLLYSIYSQILSLPNFSTINEDQTFKVIASIIDKMFYLALITVAIGATSYFCTLYLKYKRRRRFASVDLVDMKVDPHIGKTKPDNVNTKAAEDKENCQ